MSAQRPPVSVAEKLGEACELAVRFYPPAKRVLASCTIVGLPFSILSGQVGRVNTYFSQVALWLERGGRLHRPSEALGDTNEVTCSYAPLILVREECLRRELPIMVAASLLHEVEHLRRYPIYTRKVLTLVRAGLSREEAISRVLNGEEREVEGLMARLANKHTRLAEAMADADLVERSVALEDLASERVVPWPTFKHVMNFYVHAHRAWFRIHKCFGELRELLFLDAERKSQIYHRLPREAREAQDKHYEELREAANRLEVSWLFKWGDKP